MSRRYFGTDGIRGHVGEAPITPDFMLKLGWAAGRALSSGAERKLVLIGKDTRLSGYMFESALEAGLSAAGIDVALLGPLPTPAVAYLTRTFRACAGIVISASHNPHHDNGIKFFSGSGFKLPDDVEASIEDWLEKPLAIDDAAALGKAVRIEDARGRYIEFCKSTVPFSLSLDGMNIVLDCAQGATYQVAPAVFRELGAKVTVLGNQPNGLNINDGFGSTHPEALQKAVVESGADLGIAFDGDGDRVLMVDSDGRLVDGDELLYIIACHRQDKGLLKGGVVGTLMTNFGIEQALRKREIPFVRAKVGDRYVMEKLFEHDWWIGGEGSGHLVCRDVTTTGDGIVSALQVLAALRDAGAAHLSEVLEGVEKTPQSLVNVRMREKRDVTQVPEVARAVADAERELGDQGRVLLRLSGTEPVVRVMVEGTDANRVAGLAQRIADVVESLA